eukprot:CAMPEP_0167788978 /NCGR_PEP_ID=MMETSP0111_2-20121227/10390_1 /TAXON_ID=91324 /ORGANISM="Lotharella globosa, Strain CCCM811" /LENGTH=245 /DNA_ID=CAMNT_0007681015 /DNA_START=87 /DNA_END=824 /DNA_ORIENTATION=-
MNQAGTDSDRKALAAIPEAAAPPQPQSFNVMQNMLAGCPNMLNLEISQSGLSLKNRMTNGTVVRIEYESILSWGSGARTFVLRVQVGTGVSDLVFATAEGDAIKECLQTHCMYAARALEGQITDVLNTGDGKLENQTCHTKDDAKPCMSTLSPSFHASPRSTFKSPQSGLSKSPGSTCSLIPSNEVRSQGGAGHGMANEMKSSLRPEVASPAQLESGNTLLPHSSRAGDLSDAKTSAETCDPVFV